MKTCVCGYNSPKSISSHVQACLLYKNELRRVTNSAINYIEEIYLSSYSVTDCINKIIERESTMIQHGAIRKFVNLSLDNLGIREGVSGKNNLLMKQLKIKKTVRERYGVDNIGQLSTHNGFAKQNNLPYEKIEIFEELKKFRKSVETSTWNLFMKMKRKNKVPTICHYTNITFNDTIFKKVNPNDPYKRTIDHKVPITEAFLKGWSVEETSSQDNIVFCLRIINTLKSNTNYNDFVRNYLPYILKKLNESKIS